MVLLPSKSQSVLVVLLPSKSQSSVWFSSRIVSFDTYGALTFPESSLSNVVLSKAMVRSSPLGSLYASVSLCINGPLSGDGSIASYGYIGLLGSIRMYGSIGMLGSIALRGAVSLQVSIIVTWFFVDGLGSIGGAVANHSRWLNRVL